MHNDTPPARKLAARHTLPEIEDRIARRFRRMMRHTWLVMAGAVLALAGIAAFGLYLWSQPTVLRVAVGPPASEDLRLIQGLAQHLARERASVRLTVLMQGGPAEAADAMDAGQADLAVVRRDLAMPKAGQAVAILRTNVVLLMAPAPVVPESIAARKARAARPRKIEKIEDLVGRRLGVIGRTDANIRLLNAILKEYDIAPDKIAVTQFSVQDFSAAIREGKVDAVMAVGPLSSRITAEAVAAATRGKQAPAFLEIGASEAIAHRNPVYESTEIPAGTFGPQRPEDAIETIGFSHYIVARKSLDEQTAADFTRLLFAARQSLAAEGSAFSKIEKPNTDKDASVPAHPGAVAYIDGEQKSLFDRYSDSLYWGLMLLSFLGSSAAWLLSYAKADARERNMKALDQLVALMTSARTAGSMEELDAIRDKADAILKRILHQVEANEIDEGGLAAFSLALEQAQRAISDRQTVLLGLRDAG